ncbi:MAG: hypothetical protein ACP5O3_02595 [Candidatus Micrarchaeia archaeon]|jgi:hypothetical protein
MPTEQPDFETELSSEDEEESREQYWEDEYEDREGENTAATAEDKFIEMSDFQCEKCGRKTRQRVSVLFKPMCCGQPMKEVKKVEKKIGFEALLKKMRKTSKKAQAKPRKPAKPGKKAAKPKKNPKPRKPAKTKQKKKTRKR